MDGPDGGQVGLALGVAQFAFQHPAHGVQRQVVGIVAEGVFQFVAERDQHRPATPAERIPVYQIEVETK